jgi:hypothetical protein
MKLRYAAAVLAALGLTAFVPSGLAAQELQIQLDQTLVENFDGSAVADAFATFNAKVTPKTAEDGTPVVDFAFPGGVSGRAVPAMCKDDKAHTGCTGLRVMGFFQMPEGKTPADMAVLVNSFNATHEAVQVIYDTAGKSRMTYYVVADFGITKTNLVVQLYTFRQTAQAWSKVLFDKPAAAAATAPAAKN